MTWKSGRTRLAAGVIVLGLLVAGGVTIALARSNGAEARPRDLSGFAEVPAKVTHGTGTFRATITADTIQYTLTYSGLSSPATAAHIHFGQAGVNGGPVAFLCGGGTAPACPPAGGTVTGTITATDILAISTPGATDQGLSAGDFASAIALLDAGDGYLNVHSTRFAAGEIRAQITVRDQTAQAGA
jgi:hypothetical protein